MSRVVASLLDTNLTWSAWKEIAESGDVTALANGGDILADVPPGWASRLTVTSGDPSRLCVGVRVSRREALLPSAPLFYTEVRFQGRTE